MRRWPLRRLVALVAVCAVFAGGLAQAAHFHKSSSARGADSHLQCLLCAHADRWAGPPELPHQPGPALLLLSRVAAPTAPQLGRMRTGFYDIRGPPAA